MKCDDRGSIALRSCYALDRQGMPESLASVDGVDDQHANDGPLPIEKRGFLDSWSKIGDRARETAVIHADNDLSRGTQLRGSRQASEHRRPILVLIMKLAKGGDGDPVHVVSI